VASSAATGKSDRVLSAYKEICLSGINTCRIRTDFIPNTLLLLHLHPLARCHLFSSSASSSSGTSRNKALAILRTGSLPCSAQMRHLQVPLTPLAEEYAPPRCNLSRNRSCDLILILVYSCRLRPHFKEYAPIILHTELACLAPIATRIRTIVQSDFTLSKCNLG